MSKSWDDVAESELDRAYKVGISVGLGLAAGNLMDKAVAYFKVKNRECDELASRLRDISAELKTQSDNAHPNNKKETAV